MLDFFTALALSSTQNSTYLPISKLSHFFSFSDTLEVVHLCLCQNQHLYRSRFQAPCHAQILTLIFKSTQQYIKKKNLFLNGIVTPSETSVSYNTQADGVEFTIELSAVNLSIHTYKTLTP